MKQQQVTKIYYKRRTSKDGITHDISVLFPPAFS